MNRRAILPLVAVSLLAGACDDLAIPDYKNPPIEALTNPSREAVLSAATGVLEGTRDDADTYVLWGGIIGREGYFLDPNESRYVRSLFAGVPLATNFTGSSYWTTPYRNLRTANLLLAALDHPDIDLGEQDEAALRGLARTIQAVDLLQVLNTRERVPVAVNTPLDSLQYPAPIVDRAVAFATVVKLLDDARTDLQKAGPSFPIPLPSGFTQFGMDRPATFLKFNRALLARVEVYRARLGNTAGTFDAARYSAAEVALGESFLNDGLGGVDAFGDRSLLNWGAYQTYSGGAGDTENSLYDPSGKTVADSTLRRDAQQTPGGQPDARLTAKTKDDASVFTVRGLASDLRFAIYSSKPFFGQGGQGSPIPIIRNEELVLLRSEVRWFTNDKPGAIADLNLVRLHSGGLAPIGIPASDDEYVTALLRERRYSLMMEGAHRWIDWRRFGRIEALALPANSTQRVGGSGDEVVSWLPIPSNECLARPNGC